MLGSEKARNKILLLIRYDLAFQIWKIQCKNVCWKANFEKYMAN